MAESEARVRETDSTQVPAPAVLAQLSQLEHTTATASSEPLADRIRFCRLGSIAQQTAIALQLARALRQMHKRGNAHGALTSRHVLVDGENNVTVLGGDGQQATARTRRSDVEAFGRVLFEILSGEVRPDSGEPGTAELEIEQLHKGGIPPKLIELTVRCIEGHGSMGELGRPCRVLESELRNLVEPNRPAYEPTQLVVTALGVVTLVATLVWIAVS